MFLLPIGTHLAIGGEAVMRDAHQLGATSAGSMPSASIASISASVRLTLGGPETASRITAPGWTPLIVASASPALPRAAAHSRQSVVP